MSEQEAWIGVDLDGTLAVYNGWVGPTEIGDPIPLMVERVKTWIADGCNVRIFTARIFPGPFEAENPGVIKSTIEAWCLKHIGVILPVTCTKDYGMVQLWDDRCVQVIPNTGERADGKRSHSKTG